MLLSCYLTIFLLKYTYAAYFFTRFYRKLRQKSEKIVIFFAIFSLCVSTSYEKFEKKVCQNT